MNKNLILLLLFIFLLTILIIPNQIVMADSPFEFDIGVSYTHSSNNRLVVSGYSVIEVINIGTLEVRKIKRDMLTTNFRLRYLTDNTTWEIVIPYSVRRDEIIKYADTDQEGEPTLEIHDDNGLGDILLNFQSNLRYGGNIYDNTQINLGVKTTTGRKYNPDTEISFGSGFYGLKVGFSHIKQIDPVVLFGSTNYFWNIKDEDTDPGDTIQYSIGMAYALTQNFSINSRLEHSITTSTFQNNEKVIGSNVNAASLYIGGSYTTDSGSQLNLSIGAGLTEDSADFNIQINKPYYF